MVVATEVTFWRGPTQVTCDELPDMDDELDAAIMVMLPPIVMFPPLIIDELAVVKTPTWLWLPAIWLVPGQSGSS